MLAQQQNREPTVCYCSSEKGQRPGTASPAHPLTVLSPWVRIRTPHLGCSLLKAYLEWRPVRKLGAFPHRAPWADRSAADVVLPWFGNIGLSTHLPSHPLIELAIAGKSHCATTGRRRAALRNQTDQKPNAAPNPTGTTREGDKLCVEASVSERRGALLCIFGHRYVLTPDNRLV